MPVVLASSEIRVEHGGGAGPERAVGDHFEARRSSAKDRYLPPSARLFFQVLKRIGEMQPFGECAQ